MSYILDALTRAHADRTNAASAGTTLPGTPAFALPPASAGQRLPRGLLLGGLSLIVVAVLATWWLRKERAPAQAVTPPQVAAAAPASPQAPVAAPPPAAHVGSAPPPTPLQQPPKSFVGPTQSAAPVLRPPPMPANATDRALAPAPTPGQSAARGAALMPIQGRPVEAGSANQNTPPAGGTADATGTLASDAGLKVTGATYSENPAHRLLIINGKVVKEGQEVEPGLVLEIISPRSAVFKRQGTRFNINY